MRCLGRPALLAGEPDNRVGDLAGEFVGKLAEVGVWIGDADAPLRQRLAWDAGRVVGQDGARLPDNGRSHVLVVIGVCAWHLVDQVFVLDPLDLAGREKGRIAAVTLAAVSGVRLCARTITSSHSSSRASVQTTSWMPSSLSASSTSMTENGNRTLVSAKTRPPESGQ
jgi:hypothetical protein